MLWVGSGAELGLIIFVLPCRIQPRPPGVDIVVRHSSPALMGEYYGIDVGVVNREEGVGPLLDLRVGVALADISDDSAQPTGVCVCVCVLACECVCVCAHMYMYTLYVYID